MKKVLIVDDSTYIRKTIRTTLEENGFQVVGEAADGEKAIDLALELVPDIITLDNILPDMTGLDVLKILRKHENKMFVVMISAIGQESSKVDADELGANYYLVKPLDHKFLIEILNEIDHG